MGKGEERGVGVIIAIVVSVAGLFVSWSQMKVAQQNNRLTEAQTVGSFIPHLMEKSTKDMALIAMNKYVDREVVNDMAELLVSEKALEVLAETGSEKEMKSSQKSLEKLDVRQNDLVVQMYEATPIESSEAYMQLSQDWEKSPALLKKVFIESGRKNPDLKSTVKTLSLICDYSPEILRNFEEELEQYFNKLDRNDAEVNRLVEKIQEKMKKDIGRTSGR